MESGEDRVVLESGGEGSASLGTRCVIDVGVISGTSSEEASGFPNAAIRTNETSAVERIKVFSLESRCSEPMYSTNLVSCRSDQRLRREFRFQRTINRRSTFTSSFRKVFAEEYNDMTSQFDPETAENNEEIEMYISSTFVGGLANVAGNLL